MQYVRSMEIIESFALLLWALANLGFCVCVCAVLCIAVLRLFKYTRTYYMHMYFSLSTNMFTITFWRLGICCAVSADWYLGSIFRDDIKHLFSKLSPKEWKLSTIFLLMATAASLLGSCNINIFMVILSIRLVEAKQKALLGVPNCHAPCRHTLAIIPTSYANYFSASSLALNIFTCVTR